MWRLQVLALLLASPAWAVPQPATPFAECDAAISAATKPPVKLPAALLPAIARVESGRLDPASGRVRPWPWTINVEGVGSYYESKEQVIAAVQALQSRGVKSIDVGCMQVNLMHHPRAFSSLEQAFDPQSNARYAVSFLSLLYQQSRDWSLATAFYHSAQPDRGEEYQRLVFGRVMTPMGGTKLRVPATGGIWPPPGTQFAAIPPASLSYGAFATPKPTMAFGVPAIPVSTLSLGPAPPPLWTGAPGRGAARR